VRPGGPQERRLWLADLTALLEEISLFSGLSADERGLIAEQFQFRVLTGGEALINEGDKADELYVVVSGRLKAVRRDPVGEQVLGEIRRGELVGEMALMTEDRRMASVYAIRDSLVASLSREAFDELTTRFPRIVKMVVRDMVRRLTEPRTTDHRSNAGMTIALIGAGSDRVDLDAFAERLVTALGKIGNTITVRAGSVPPGAGNRAAARLNAIELQHRFLVYIADDDEAWTQLCLRQADRVLLVAAAQGDPGLGRLEADLDGGHPPILAQRDLILLHKPETSVPSGTRDWLALRPKVARHFHVRSTNSADFDRLARILAQQPIGLVLGGGGARGFAHLGVYRALGEAGIPIDLVGGTSIGSVFSGLIALGLDWQEVRERCRGLEDTKLDYTLPLVALGGGFGLAAEIRRLLGEIQIEDFWLPYFCVSANLTKVEIAIHRFGPASKWIRASCSLPGVLPPVFDGAEIHVDGCILNNLPTDIMRTNCRGPVIAVDIDQSFDISTDLPYSEGLSGWRVLASRLKPIGTRPRVPAMGRLLHRSAMVTSTQNSLRARTEADLYLHPPVGNCGVLDWKMGGQLAALGHEYATKMIAAWPLAPGLATGDCSGAAIDPDLKPIRAAVP
jgi:predicted acylesterase/phospholipase RssA